MKDIYSRGYPPGILKDRGAYCVRTASVPTKKVTSLGDQLLSLVREALLLRMTSIHSKRVFLVFKAAQIYGTSMSSLM